MLTRREKKARACRELNCVESEKEGYEFLMIFTQNVYHEGEVKIIKRERHLRGCE